MKVVLLEVVENIGVAGDVVEVADGFARNVLFPHGKAAVATQGKLAEVKAAVARSAKRAVQELAAFQRVVSAVDGKTIHLPAPVGPQGKLHGSVTGAQVARAIETHLGVHVTGGAVRLAEPIRQPGEHRVLLEFPHGLEAQITVVVAARSRGVDAGRRLS